MKKRFSALCLALTVMLSMAVPAFAAEQNASSGNGQVSISWDDQAKEVELGGSATFEVDSSKSKAKTIYYQWSKDRENLGSRIEDANTYTIGNASFLDAGLYSVHASGNKNGGGNTADTAGAPMELKVYTTVTFAYDENTNVGQKVYNSGLAERPADPVREGYSFTGWLLDGNEFDFTTPITGNITLTAGWEAATYTVAFDYKGAEGLVSSKEVTYGNAYGELPEPTREGYVFGGWSTDGTVRMTKRVTSDTIVNTAGDHTLTALWGIDTTKMYKITYDGNGGTAPADTMNYGAGSVARVADGASRDGFTFTGWNTQTNGRGTAYQAGDWIIVNSNVTLYAQWTRDVYKVSYDGNGATGGTVPADTMEYYSGGALGQVLDQGSLSRDGYTFTGWNTQADGKGTTYQTGAWMPVGGSVTLYAQWTQNVYKVSYDGNGATGGTAPADTMAYYSGGALGQVLGQGSLSRNGFTFAGWNTQANGRGTTYQTGAWMPVDSNVTLYAQWTQNVYRVTYDGNGATGGTAPVDTMDYYGMIAVQAPNQGSLSCDGYTFTGWNTRADGGGTAYRTGGWIFSQSSITLYAQWS